MIDLLKIDIEGSEQDLIEGEDRAWLQRVKEIVIEFHPTISPNAKLIDILIGAGFTYWPPQKSGLKVDYFKRQLKS